MRELKYKFGSQSAFLNGRPTYDKPDEAWLHPQCHWKDRFLFVYEDSELILACDATPVIESNISMKEFNRAVEQFLKDKIKCKVIKLPKDKG